MYQIDGPVNISFYRCGFYFHQKNKQSTSTEMKKKKVVGLWSFENLRT